MATTTEYFRLPAHGGLAEVVFNTPAWNAWDYSGFFDGADWVGENRPIDGVSGRMAVLHDIDEKTIVIPIDVFGGADKDGTPYGNERIGMRTNLVYLQTNLLAIPATSDGTRPGEFHRMDGVVLTGDVQVNTRATVSFESGELARMAVKITIPAGRLT